MKSKKIASIILTTIMAASIFAGCGGNGGTAKKEGTKKKKEETLTVYAGLMEDHAEAAVKAFEKETGIKTNMVRMSGGEILARIQAEKDNTKASIWYGGPADTFIEAKEKGLLEPYKSPNADKIEDRFKDKDGYWTGIYHSYLGFVCNKKLLDEKKAEVPKSWEDLLKPEYKGQIVMANPGSSGTAYTAVATAVQLMGEEKGMEYLKKLDGQIKQYPKTGSGPAQMAGMGEAMIGICFMHDGSKYKEQGYKDIVLSAPSEGTGYETGSVAIIKGAPNKSAAKKFVDWSLTKEAQEVGQKTGSFQFLTNPDAKAPEEAKEEEDALESSKPMNYDVDFAGKNRTRLVDKWHSMTNK